MLFAWNEYACAAYDGSKVRVWCDVRLSKSGVFGEFEARGVVRLFISPGESGCVNIFVAALLEDGRLIVRVLDYEHKRFHEAWGQTRMDRTPTSVHVYNNTCWEPTTILCKIVVGFDPDDVCLYEWASGSTAIVSTMIPIPPSQCVRLRQNRNAFGTSSIAGRPAPPRIVAPVVVNPLMTSKKASEYESSTPVSTHGTSGCIARSLASGEAAVVKVLSIICPVLHRFSA